MIRYSLINEKNPREIVLLRGTGCKWRKCSFCDYHLDCSSDMEENILINRHVIENVTGIYNHLEVINSGSFIELGEVTLNDIVDLCKNKKICIVHFECHYLYRNEILKWRDKFAEVGTELKIKTGVETFEYDFRENILNKGIKEKDPAKISEHFNECCLLFGLKGQTAESMKKDIETGLEYFERVCVNIFVENQTKIKPDESVIEIFKKEIYPLYINNERVDILMNNTDFGVGGE